MRYRSDTSLFTIASYLLLFSKLRKIVFYSIGDQTNDLMNAPLPDPATTMDTWTRKRKITFPMPIMDTYPEGPRLPGAAEPRAAEPDSEEPDRKRRGGKRTKRRRPKRKSRRKL